MDLYFPMWKIMGFDCRQNDLFAAPCHATCPREGHALIELAWLHLEMLVFFQGEIWENHGEGWTLWE
jgi:hypothetical protein